MAIRVGLVLVIPIVSLRTIAAAPPLSTAACRQPRGANEQCWKAHGPTEVACCAADAESSCWSGPHTPSRCCNSHAILALPACDDGDWAFLAELPLLFETGALPAAVKVPTDTRGLSDMLSSTNIDDEAVRCPVATLARLLLLAEMVAVLGTAEALGMAADAYDLAMVLHGAAVARGAISANVHIYPEWLVYTELNRLRLARIMHADPRGTMNLLFELSGSDRRRMQPSCIVDVSSLFGCLITRSGGRNAIIVLELLLMQHHAQAVMARSPEFGLPAVLLARLFGSSTVRGLRVEESNKLLGAASEIATLVVRPRSGAINVATRLLLARALSDMRNHMANKTTRWYAEADKEPFILEALRKTGTKTHFFVEVGVGTGRECNTRYLREQLGWTGIMVDQMASNPAIGLHRRFLSAGNCIRVMEELGVPDDFDLLSIDVDGNDFWLWRTMAARYRPRVVVIEYLPTFGSEDVVTRYAASGLNFARPDTRHTSLLGASLRALVALAHSLGYSLASVVLGYDAIFARSELLTGPEAPLPVLPEVPAARRLLEGDFHISSAAALAEESPVAIKEGWTAACLEEAFGALCSRDDVAPLCRRS